MDIELHILTYLRSSSDSQLVFIHIKEFRWIGHTLRKEDGEIPKAALHWNPQGNRKRGRPRNSWRRSGNQGSE
jgi:hypothetical protein